jgi:hypothetical protein
VYLHPRQTAVCCAADLNWNTVVQAIDLVRAVLSPLLYDLETDLSLDVYQLSGATLSSSVALSTATTTSTSTLSPTSTSSSSSSRSSTLTSGSSSTLTSRSSSSTGSLGSTSSPLVLSTRSSTTISSSATSSNLPIYTGPPVISEGNANFSYYGCVGEPSSGRALPKRVDASSVMTVELCLGECWNYKYAGLEWRQELVLPASITLETFANL